MVEVFLKTLLIIFLILTIPGVIILAVYIPINIYKHKYHDFILDHSIALRKLNELNKRYSFRYISNMDVWQVYDNENYFYNMNCTDELVYLVYYNQQRVAQVLADTIYNRNLYNQYLNEVKAIPLFKYDAGTNGYNYIKLNNCERKMFDEKILKPTIELLIFIQITLNRMNGELKTQKSQRFHADEIAYYVNKFSYINGIPKYDNVLWKAICHVEHARVTNRIRFLVYQRDGYRCRYCGSTYNLEVDHIYPVFKGGRTTVENLQTLCHNCNVRKGTKLYY